jgi:hypothetical protein
MSSMRSTSSRDDIPVDMVFTWVDGHDPAHAEKRRHFESLYPGSDIRPDTRADRNPEARFVDVGEIAFSVQSVVKYLPWVRTIYIVTDSQVPPVSRQLVDSGRVRVVDHTALIPAEYLPTFSSRVIESCLYRIPGLSEIFLYNNDDYMHFSPVPRRTFCAVTPEGRVLLELQVKLTIVQRLLYAFSSLYPMGERAGSLHAIGIYNAYAMLRRRRHGICARDVLIPRHSTQVIRRSTAERLEADFGEALGTLRRQQFRNVRGFSYATLLYTMERVWNPETRVRRALLQDVSHQFRMFDFTGFMVNGHTERLWDKVARSKAQFVCLNNIPGTDHERFLDVMTQKGLQEPPHTQAEGVRRA